MKIKAPVDCWPDPLARSEFERYIRAAGGYAEAARRLQRSESWLKKVASGARRCTPALAREVEIDAMTLPGQLFVARETLVWGAEANGGRRPQRRPAR